MKNSKNPKQGFTICIIGDPQSGKSSIFRRLISEPMEEYNIFSTMKPKSKFDFGNFDFNNAIITLYDISFDNPVKSFCGHADGIFFVVDVTKEINMSAIRKIKTGIEKDLGNVPCIILANKYDDNGIDLGLNKYKLSNLCLSFTDVLYVSAKNNTGIQEAMKKMHHSIITRGDCSVCQIL